MTDPITMQDRVERLLTPPAPAGALLTTAEHIRPGDRLTQGRGSRYKGHEFTVATVERNRVYYDRVDVTGTRGERLMAVSVAAAYYVHRTPQEHA